MSVKERWRGQREITLSSNELLRVVLSITDDESRVLAGYVFGSRGRGRAEKESDLDLAVWTSPEFGWEDYYVLYGRITKELRSDRLDLVWLNKTEPVLAFEIIKTGKMIFCRDADLLNDFEIKAKKRFFDYRFYLDRHRGVGSWSIEEKR